ncbi:restriction endonuclease subunit S [Shewanella xiamenensis]|uniref:restriction endonuclease subunit S n=1 Tax=Shewanella xiamenensis TaxID=332186 RepID=UPI0035B77037
MNNSVQQIPVGYKNTEIGLVPEDWVEKFFGDICTVNQGLQIPIEDRKKTQVEGSKVYLTIQYLNSQDLPEFISNYTPSVCCDESDILMTRTGNTGIVVHGVSGVFHNNFFKIRFDRKKINDLFLVYVLRSHRCQKTILEKAGTSTIPDLNHGDFYSIKLALPDYKEQTAIANALSDVDALIQELEKLIAKKQAIKTATMQQLLTGRTRLPAFAYEKSAHHPDGRKKGYKPSELGEIPEDWAVSSLKELLKENPKYGINAAAVPLEGNLPVYIRITDISEDGYFKPSEKVGVKSPFSGMYQLNDGDIVLTRTGASVGKSYLYRAEDGILVYAGFLIKISPEQSILEPKFLFQYLKTEQYWSWVTVNSMRSGQPGINGNEYGSLLIPCPFKDEQIAIATILSDMDEDVQSLENRLNKTRQIKQGMMQELLTGKTRLVQPINREAQHG